MATAYDEIPYANLPFAQTRPAVLATVATLHGLTPPDPREARVLELGCGAGANLAGIAAADPGVRAVGVDLAPTAVEVAQATAAAAGLENVTFDVGDVLALTEGELGEFDYVIVHGLYAWAPEHVREAVLAACRSHLSPDGIAYLSYTAHPGGHMRQMLREMAQWHARGLEEPLERAERARGLFTLLDQLGESAGPSFYSGRRGGGRARARDRARLDARARPARLDLRAGLVHGVRRGDRPPRDGLRRGRVAGEQPRAAVVARRLRLRRRRRPATTASRASSTSTCS